MKVEILPLTYEDRLSQDLHWALDEGGLFFDEQGSVYESLRRIVAHLNVWDIEYAVTADWRSFITVIDDSPRTSTSS